MSTTDEPQRPEPEALLAEAAREGRGRLKVYLGMAPGVGKTYAMLETARRLKAQGNDVVVGIVETHGRADTQALVAGMEVLPRRAVPYRRHKLEEFDIDAALARRPKLLLVDELAHSNAPQSRHPKRWQDVDELVKAGIDVHTTLNIQHLEGLNDIVARITGVRVQETLPDRVLEQADEIELVDLTPQELIDRLNEGKVYVAQLAGRALEQFFRPGNLTALRELALRRTAERVDKQMVGYMQSHAIAGPWPAGERIMVCVGGEAAGRDVVRAGRRLAEQFKAPWIAVHVESVGRMVESGDNGVAEVLALAERLEARTARLSGADLPGEILRYARRNNVTQIVIGRSRSGWLREALRRSLVHELVRRSEGIAIHVVTPEGGAQRHRRRIRLDRPTLGAVATAVLGTAGVVGLAYAIPDLRLLPVVSMLFLAAVLLSAVLHGLTAALVSAVVAFLAYNFFFTQPYFTLQVEHWRDVVALLVFLVVAGTTGTLAGRVRDQVRAAQARMTALQILYDFARRLGASKAQDALLHAIVLQAHRLTELPAMILLPEGDDMAIRYAWPPEDTLPEAARAAARWAKAHVEPAGAQTDTLPASPWHFRPLRTGDGAAGVLGVQTGGKAMGADLSRTLDAMLDQAAVAIERLDFQHEASRVEAIAESERLRNALLSSVSHDLRTPLTAILGSATALRRDAAQLGPEDREDLLTTIVEETERLDRFVNNLLDVSRLEAGAMEIKREWLVIEEAVGSAIRRVEGRLGSRMLVRSIAPDLPLLRADAILLETVLVNLLDNAIKHGPDATRIEVAAALQNGRIVLSVTDDGPGVPREHQGRLFDKFYRVQRTDRAAAGTGLGLSICKGLAEAMGGRIAVTSPVEHERGARFTVSFPLEDQPEAARAMGGNE